MPPYGTTPFATRERFDAELAVGCGVTHANIARILDAGASTWGEPFMVTEALVGETLGERLRDMGKLAAPDALSIAREAARGLGAIHQAGFVHRDVKPDNLFLCDADRHGVAVKVIDFGFSTKPDRASSEGRKILGTLEYIAPEQAVADSIDGRADVYSLGVVLFRTITGELPFDASARSMITHHLRSTLPPPSWLVEDLPPSIDRLVLSATRKHPDNRYVSMNDFLADLDAALCGLAVRGAPLRVEPDGYRPATEDCREAFDALSAEH
jgi:serine/threonine-protein kinase